MTVIQRKRRVKRSRLIEALDARGHAVRALVRHSSTHRLPAHAVAVTGNALDAASIAGAAAPGDTLVHLVGTPHPNPSKAAEFERVDLESIRASVAAAKERYIAHLVYMSVAHPAPAMHAYVAARVAGEDAIADAGPTATILRPWYVLGPGHWWPVVLLLLYPFGEVLPATRESARRLGLVSVAQMVRALVQAVESPPHSRATPLRGSPSSARALSGSACGSGSTSASPRPTRRRR